MLSVMPAILLITGPVGVGKSAILAEAEVLLRDAGMPYATVVLPELARAGPGPADDPYNEALMYRNLGAVWSNYSAGGRIDRLLLEKLVDHRTNLARLHETIPDAELIIVRLRAPLDLIEKRLRRREPDPEGELSAARWWTERMDGWAVEDAVVENDGRPIRDVAAEVLSVAGWL
jgi:hypothetical protein